METQKQDGYSVIIEKLESLEARLDRIQKNVNYLRNIYAISSFLSLIFLLAPLVALAVIAPRIISMFSSLSNSPQFSIFKNLGL